MQSVNDPITSLFFAYPFVFLFAAAFVFAFAKGAIKGRTNKKGVTFGLLLFVLVTLPNRFVIYTSMTYPLGFFISDILAGLVGLPMLGFIFANVYQNHFVFLKKPIGTKLPKFLYIYYSLHSSHAICWAFMPISDVYDFWKTRRYIKAR